MKALLARVLDLLYPRACGHCGRVGLSWCAACADELAAYPFVPVWRTVADGLPVVAAAPYRGIIRSALHALKFEDARDLAGLFGDQIARMSERSGYEADVIVPVPLHALRERQRGYNQAMLLAIEAGAILSLPAAAALMRTRSTGTQVGRSIEARAVAVQGAFAVTENMHGARVLLVDDIVTTGATLVSCARALQDAGAAQVMAACAASA